MKKSERDFNYKNVISKNGDFSARITDKKLVKKLDAYCLITNTNKTKYITKAVERALSYDLDDLDKIIKMKEE